MGISKRRLNGGRMRYQATLRRTSDSVTRTFDSESEAAKWLRHAKRNPPASVPATRPEPRPESAQDVHTVGEALSLYVRDVSPRKRGVRQERTRASWLIRQAFAQRKVHELNAAELDRYVLGRLSSGVSGSTLRKELALVSCAYQYLIVKHGRADLKNPVKHADKPAAAPPRQRRLTPKESVDLPEFFKSHGYDEVAIAFTLAVETGLRRGELLQLEFGNLDLEARTAVVRQAKKGRRPDAAREHRTIGLSPIAVDAIGRVKGPRTGRVLQLSAYDIEYVWKRAKKALKIRDLRWHDLRHECASRLAMRGVPHALVQQQLGHATWGQTRDYQSFTSDEMALAVAPSESPWSQSRKSGLGVADLERLFTEFCRERLGG